MPEMQDGISSLYFINIAHMTSCIKISHWSNALWEVFRISSLMSHASQSIVSSPDMGVLTERIPRTRKYSKYTLSPSLEARLVNLQGGPKKTTPNFGSHFDIFLDKKYNLFLDANKEGLFGKGCEKKNNFAFILFKT